MGVSGPIAARVTCQSSAGVPFTRCVNGRLGDLIRRTRFFHAGWVCAVLDRPLGLFFGRCTASVATLFSEQFTAPVETAYSLGKGLCKVTPAKLLHGQTHKLSNPFPCICFQMRGRKRLEQACSEVCFPQLQLTLTPLSVVTVIKRSLLLGIRQKDKKYLL
jgi:hypothetical protein